MSFWKSMEEIVNQGLSVSREVWGKAKEKAMDLGDKGILKYEIMQLEKEASNKFFELGTKVYEILVKENKNTVSKSTAGVKELILEIKKLEETVNRKENELKGKK